MMQPRVVSNLACRILLIVHDQNSEAKKNIMTNNDVISTRLYHPTKVRQSASYT